MTTRFKPLKWKHPDFYEYIARVPFGHLWVDRTNTNEWITNGISETDPVFGTLHEAKAYLEEKYQEEMEKYLK